MKLIKKIEVYYYRSLYKATLNNVGDLNVIFGRNDSGKSNLLRALNLFFNGKIDSGHDFDFSLDMSDPRKKEAREAKGRQFLWIRITFNVPENYEGALGKTIAIKKQWNRDGKVNQVEQPALPSVGKKARLTRFLNDIDFTYIPAVKDIEVYSDLIERLYGAAAETDTLQNATRDFIAAISGETSDLTTQLTDMLGAPASIRPPTDMKRLFRNLDFAQGIDNHSLLRQKGDGIKARYLPELLHFINENEVRSKFYLWGFEEPENSLDLGAATTEAKRFAEFASCNDVQIFITSHSPAFYLAEAENVAANRFFISKQEYNDSNEMVPPNAAERIDEIEDAERVMDRAGLLQLPFVIRQMEVQKTELEEYKEKAEVLRNTLLTLNQPTLFVEGSHDVTLFSSALRRMEHDHNIAVRPLNGTPGTVKGLFKALLANGGVNPAAPTLFLYDNDEAGRDAARALTGKSVGEEPAVFSDTVFVWTLPMSVNFKQFLDEYSIQEKQAIFTAEFLFPVVDANNFCLEFIEMNQENQQISKWKSTIHNKYFETLKNQQTVVSLLNAEPGTAPWLYARGVPNLAKEEFTNRAIEEGWNTADIDGIINVVADRLLNG
ncbi:MAG: hypothetical protein COA84_14590 [Robiginitomaculum sp.]|nr:MAG: hypothetical protein COA84_14590 [Robiginitomaculum sp.]